MTKKLFLLFFLIHGLICFSQEDRVTLIGKVKVDSLSTENIHIINKTSNVATLTNKYGEFKIPVKEKDTLLFSSIEFQNKQVKINKTHLIDLKIIVKLVPAINNLEEVEVKNHNLTGNLAIDARNNKDSIYERIESRLKLSSAEIIDAFDKAKTKQTEYSVDPTRNIGGVDIAQLFRFVRLKLKKKKKEKNTEKKFNTEIIRNEFGDDFFVNNLNIPLAQVDAFLIFCTKKGLAKLYLEDRRIELIELLINQSKAYLKEK